MADENNSSGTVTPADIPAHVMDTLARTLLRAAERFYQDPENLRRFEEWKARKDAQAST